LAFSFIELLPEPSARFEATETEYLLILLVIPKSSSFGKCFVIQKLSNANSRAFCQAMRFSKLNFSSVSF
jgi:hypothetical protein